MALMHRVKWTIPASVIWGTNQETDIAEDTLVEVKKFFWRNGEGWAQLADGRQCPDVFLSLKPVKN